VLYASSHDGVWRLGGSSVLPRKVVRPQPDVLPGTGVGTPALAWAILGVLLMLALVLLRHTPRRASR
jgi:hypothetical protein